MSNPAAEPSPLSPEGDLGALPLRCPRCDATLHDEQSWCLECGAPARTRLAPSPNWRIPAAIVAAAIILATAALAFAFVRLTDDQGAPAAPPPRQGQPAPTPTAPPAPGQPPPAPTAPAPGQPAPAPPAPPAPDQPPPAPPAPAAPRQPAPAPAPSP